MDVGASVGEREDRGRIVSGPDEGRGETLLPRVDTVRCSVVPVARPFGRGAADRGGRELEQTAGEVRPRRVSVDDAMR